MYKLFIFIPSRLVGGGVATLGRVPFVPTASVKEVYLFEDYQLK